MRTYSALLLFETLFDSTQPSDTHFNTLLDKVFSPQVTVVMEDCGTRIGDIIDVNYETEGRVELSTGLPISRNRILDLLSQGYYKVKTRTLSTCTAEGGVCASCYHASRPLEYIPDVGDKVTVQPIYDKGSEAIYLPHGGATFSVSLDEDFYDTIMLFHNGQLITSGFSVAGTVITMNTPFPPESHIVARYTSVTRAPYLLWMAHTYSGHLLGVKPLPAPPLPIRPSLLLENIPKSLVDLVIDGNKELSSIPKNMIEYLEGTEDTLEQALFAIALRTIYSNVST